MRTLNLTPEHIIAPGHSHLFAAVGAALQAKEETHYTLDEISGKLTADLKIAVDVDRLPPLFASQEDYDAFIKKQEKIKYYVPTLPPTRGNVSSVSTPVPQQQKSHWLPRMAVCSMILQQQRW